jgi:DNA-binding transcriptional ArsR family regulator
MRLKPLLWKSCRVIACESRLRLLWALFENQELSVSRLCFMLQMSQPNASNQLRMLNDCGLIAFRRKKMNVLYRPEANELTEFAPELLKALRSCYDRSDSLDSVIQRATAFTHQRRLEIVRVLSEESLSLIGLQQKTGMSAPALSRHLKKLARRGVLRAKGRLYVLIQRPDHPLGKALLKLALS